MRLIQLLTTDKMMSGLEGPFLIVGTFCLNIMYLLRRSSRFTTFRNIISIVEVLTFQIVRCGVGTRPSIFFKKKHNNSETLLLHSIDINRLCTLVFIMAPKHTIYIWYIIETVLINLSQLSIWNHIVATYPSNVISLRKVPPFPTNMSITVKTSNMILLLKG